MVIQESKSKGQRESPILAIDVAHPPRHPDEVEEELLRAWSEVRNSSTLRILKIIHGYGSKGKGGSTKEVVRNWVFRNRIRFREIVNGEEYGVYSQQTQKMREELGAYFDSDLESGNSGITVVWVK